ncbi:helix-turn-helix domain-containing protein [Streptomyces sp. 5.8]|uniref:helix-turn-helix domain-containing protein n=1 Tax=Streptomyces sp. 5.8 TaxID=3406571 RepID=UPI003BB68987
MGSWDSYTTGERIKILRGPDLTQERLAELTGLSVQTIRAAEQDATLTLPTVLALSDALHADAAVILGQQAPRRAMSTGDRQAARALSAAVHDSAAGLIPEPAEETPPTAAALTAAVNHVWEVCSDGDYSRTASLAAPLLRAAVLYRHTAPADEQGAAEALLSDAYRAAATAANYVGSRDLAYAAVGNAAHHAARSSDPVRAALAATLRSRVLLRDARLVDARRVAEETARLIEPSMSERDPRVWAAYGRAVVFAAVVASRLGDADLSADLLSEAHAAAARLGRDVRPDGAQFGPSYATHQAIGIHVAIGSTGQALSLAEQFRDRSGLSHASRSRVDLDVAVAQCDARQWDAALDTLLHAADDNPTWVRHQALAGVIMQRAGRGSTTRLRRAAAALGIPTGSTTR